MNSINLTGRLTRDVELKFAQGSGNAVARFSVAVQRNFKKDEADFINCVAFGKTAETINQFMSKGSQIAISGELRIGSYDNKEGNKVNTADVIVNNFSFIGNKGDKQESTSNTNNSKSDDDFTPVDDGDMPF